jgi:hypothetical protein
MAKNDAHGAAREAAPRSIDYLRKRSQHRIWWNSARIALLRGRPGESLNQPIGQSAIGKRV